MILFGTGLSCKLIKNTTKRHTHITKQSLLPFQGASPNILQNIFKYLNLEDFSTIQIAYQKSKSLILQKQFLKISKTFSKKTLHGEIIFEFINFENLSPTKQTKFFIFFAKPIKFSNFINHVMIYHKFRFISYIDGSFSIELKNENSKHYIPSTVKNLLIPKNCHKLLENPSFFNILKTSSKQFLNFALDRERSLYILFKNAQITISEQIVLIDSGSATYFVSLDKTYVVRFFDSNFFVYHIPTGKGFSFKGISKWKEILMNSSAKLDFEFFMQYGEFLPSCHHPNLKQMIFENTINGCKDEGNSSFSITFLLNDRKAKSIVSSFVAWDAPNYPWSSYM
jgi:hypothetical protein